MKKQKRVSNKKKLKRIKILTFVCMFILLFELIYIGYFFFCRRHESLYFDGINSFISTKDFYVTVGSNNDNDSKYEKAKISKYNLKKEKKFEKVYNIGYNSAFFGISVDGDNLVAVGSYEKSEKEHDASIRRGLIVAYDKDGEIVFENEFKLLDNTRFTNIVSLDDGYLVTGQSIYQNTKVGSKSGGAILAKYDKDGKLLWYQAFGDNKVGVYNDLVLANDSIYVVGLSNDHEGVICQYDMDGNLLSSQIYGEMDEIGFHDILYFEDHLYVCGSDGNDAIILEYDYDFNILNEVTYQGDGSARYHKMMLDSHNDIILIGVITQNKNNNDKSIEQVNYDGIIGKYHPSLEEVSVVAYGDLRDDLFTDIQFVDNHYLVVGYSSYEDGSYFSKFIRYSDALKVLEVEQW